MLRAGLLVGSIIAQSTSGGKIMPVVLTLTAKVKDWKTLEQFSNELLIDHARRAGVIHYRVYRNIYDASLALFLVEVLDSESLKEVSEAIGEALGEQLKVLPEEVVSDERVWEPTDWMEIR
jgi:hypothetical protein